MSDATPILSAGQVRELLAANGLSSPSELGLHEPGRADGLEWGALDRASATAALEAHQRLFNLGGDLELSERLMGRGFHSAARIATTPERTFVEGHGEALGLSPEAAGALHRRAVGTLNRTMHLVAAVHGSVASPHFRAMRVGSVPDDAVKRFQDLPSYQDLFGSLDYCACDHCKSILGPAAYFVDLMRIVDEYVTTPNKTTIPDGLKLDERRPDLQLIPLTCAKTNDTVPYLRIVNERLTASLRELTQIGSDDELFLLLATRATYPILLPYNDPLGRIRVLAETVGVELAEVYARWGGAEAAVVQESLGLSPERAAIVTTPAADTTALAALYGTLPANLPDLK
ncbi:MAG: hypothetical protein ICV87_14030, partial [Gemmatimonadetes bacterium]|nr:hypothetical protein [Gemmatimonadota bacterium]